jgi:hypothetical protein
MLKINISSIIAIGMIASLSACTKKGDTGATGPAGAAGPSYTGAISGHVSLYDQYGSKVLTGLESAQISLNGSTAINANTSGYYIFGGTMTGSYTLTASANGYGATRVSNFQYLSDTLNRDIKMSAIPNFSPATFNVYPTAAGTGDLVVMTFTTDPRVRSCTIFLNNNSTCNNLPANYLLTYTRSIGANVPRAVIIIPTQDLIDAGFTSGSTVYFSAYGSAVNDVSAYEDYSTGKAVYNAVSASPLTTTAIVP